MHAGEWMKNTFMCMYMCVVERLKNELLIILILFDYFWIAGL